MQNNFYPLMPLSPYWAKLESAYGTAMGKLYKNQESLGNVVEGLHTQFNQILSGK